MSAKTITFSLAAAVVIIMQSVNSYAIEPPNMKRLTEEDKFYFGTRLDKEQFEKLQQVISRPKTSNQPCTKAAETNKTLKFLGEVTPLFQEASSSADISSYARNYSTSLAQELVGTRKALTEILPHYKKACAATKQAGAQPN